VLDMVAGADLGYDSFGFSCLIPGNQAADGLADDLLAGVAMHPGRGRVPARDDALERLADDRILRALDDRRHTLEYLERLPLLGHVTMNRRRADNDAVLVVDRRDGDRDRNLHSVLSDTNGLGA